MLRKVLLQFGVLMIVTLTGSVAHCATFQIPIATINCNALSDDLTNNQIFLLENYIDALQTQMPSFKISESVFWWDGALPFNGNPHPVPPEVSTFGNVAWAIDPGQAYIKQGYPNHQYVWPYSFATMGIWESVKNLRQEWRTYPVPRTYIVNKDAFIMAAECQGGGVVSGSFIAIMTDNEYPVFPEPPAENYLLNIPVQALKMTKNAPVLSTRTSIVGAPFAVTSIRVHISYPVYYVNDIEAPPASQPPSPTNFAHMGVAAQSGSTSSASGAFTEFTFNQRAGILMTAAQWAWSDCMTVNFPVGQSLLISSSMNVAPPPGSTGSNAWYFTDGLSSASSWVVLDPAQWNAASLSGAVTSQPGRAHVIDRVQVNCR